LDPPTQEASRPHNHFFPHNPALRRGASRGGLYFSRIPLVAPRPRRFSEPAESCGNAHSGKSTRPPAAAASHGRAAVHLYWTDARSSPCWVGKRQAPAEEALATRQWHPALTRHDSRTACMDGAASRLTCQAHADIWAARPKCPHEPVVRVSLAHANAVPSRASLP